MPRWSVDQPVAFLLAAKTSVNPGVHNTAVDLF